jgi:DNA polymerase III epsilon subunit-like protein
VFCPAACFEPLDTVSLARWASFVAPTQPKDHKLGSLCAWLGIEHDDAHDAMGDVRATVQVARVLSERFELGRGT